MLVTSKRVNRWQQEHIAAKLRNNEAAQEHVENMEFLLDQVGHHMTQWDEKKIR